MDIGDPAYANLEDGVLLKYDSDATQVALPGSYIWKRVDADLDITYTIQRNAKIPPNNWQTTIVHGTCFGIAREDQEIDEDVPETIEYELMDFFGVCVPNPPIAHVTIEMYATVDLALVDYPDLQNFNWPDY